MSKESTTFQPTSPRHDVALRLKDTLECIGRLDEVYGISMQRDTDSRGKNHWSILFCRARTVDGLIRVYSDRYITVAVQQRRGIEKFTSCLEAQKWLMKEFI